MGQDEFTSEAIRLSLKRMCEPTGAFSMDTMRTCLDSARIVIPSEDRRTLEPLDGVSWADMPEEMRRALQQRIVAVFSLPGMESLEEQVAEPGLFRRLLGKGD